jgi:hypothetical protein
MYNLIFFIFWLLVIIPLYKKMVNRFGRRYKILPFIQKNPLLSSCIICIIIYGTLLFLSDPQIASNPSKTFWTIGAAELFIGIILWLMTVTIGGIEFDEAIKIFFNYEAKMTNIDGLDQNPCVLGIYKIPFGRPRKMEGFLFHYLNENDAEIVNKGLIGSGPTVEMPENYNLIVSEIAKDSDGIYSFKIFRLEKDTYIFWKNPIHKKTSKEISFPKSAA